MNLSINVDSSEAEQAARNLERLADAAERAEKAHASLHGFAHGGVRIQIVGDVAQVDVFALQPEYTVENTVNAGKCVKVELDGVELDNAIAADTRHGFVDMTVLDEGGAPKFDASGEVITERKFGKVVVTPM